MTTKPSGNEMISSEEQQLIIRQYNGPIPPASELEQLKRVDPSFPERVMRIAEAHAASDIRRKDRFSLSPILGQIASFLICCIGFGTAILFGLKGIEVGAITATNADNKVYTWNIHLNRGNFMEITTKQLRIQPGRIISQVNNGQEITITYRGKACAKIIPINAKKTINLEDADNELFGMWKDRNDMEDVEQYVRNIRKGRKLC